MHCAYKHARQLLHAEALVRSVLVLYTNSMVVTDCTTFGFTYVSKKYTSNAPVRMHVLLHGRKMLKPPVYGTCQSVIYCRFTLI